MKESKSWFVWAGVGLKTLVIPFCQFVSVAFKRSDDETLSSHAWSDDPGCVVAYLSGWGRW